MPILLNLLYLTAHFASKLLIAYFAQNFASKFGQGLLGSSSKLLKGFHYLVPCPCSNSPTITAPCPNQSLANESVVIAYFDASERRCEDILLATHHGADHPIVSVLRGGRGTKKRGGEQEVNQGTNNVDCCTSPSSCSCVMASVFVCVLLVFWMLGTS